MAKRSPHGPTADSRLDLGFFEDLVERACGDLFLAMVVDLNQPWEARLTVEPFATVLSPKLETVLTPTAESARRTSSRPKSTSPHLPWQVYVRGHVSAHPACRIVGFDSEQRSRNLLGRRRSVLTAPEVAPRELEQLPDHLLRHELDLLQVARVRELDDEEADAAADVVAEARDDDIGGALDVVA